MPRHHARFQRAFFRWFDINRSRFVVPVRLKALKGSQVKIEFANHPECMRITANDSNLCVWVDWNEKSWDGLLDLDVLPVRTRNGLLCRLCEDKEVRWNSLEELWADHLFEPFLNWVNNDFATAKSLRLFGECKSSTWASLCKFPLPDDSEHFVAEVPLVACHQPNSDLGKSFLSLEEQHQMLGRGIQFWQPMDEDKPKRHPRSPETDEQSNHVRNVATLDGATGTS